MQQGRQSAPLQRQKSNEALPSPPSNDTTPHLLVRVTAQPSEIDKGRHVPPLGVSHGAIRRRARAAAGRARSLAAAAAGRAAATLEIAKVFVSGGRGTCVHGPVTVVASERATNAAAADRGGRR